MIGKNYESVIYFYLKQEAAPLVLSDLHVSTFWLHLDRSAWCQLNFFFPYFWGCLASLLMSVCLSVSTFVFYSLSLFLLPGVRPCLDVQSVHASLLVDGERPRVQGDTHQPPSVMGAEGPPIYIYIWLPDGFPVHRGGSLLAADTPGCKCSGWMINTVKFFFFAVPM